MFDPFRIFYVDVTMSPDASLEDTLERVDEVQAAIGPLPRWCPDSMSWSGR